MTSVRKGAIVGGIAIFAVTLIWALGASTDEGDCLDATGPQWSDGCQCDPTPPDLIFTVGLVLGTPCGIACGALTAALAGATKRYRKLVLALAAPVFALLLAAIAAPAMVCSTDPSGVELFARAFVPLALAALALERWTHPPDPLPLARLRKPSAGHKPDDQRDHAREDHRHRAPQDVVL